MGKYKNRFHGGHGGKKAGHGGKDNIMEENKKSENIEDVNPEDIVVEESAASAEASDAEAVIEEAAGELKDSDSDLSSELEKVKDELAKEKKEYLFLMAEFDNFRKRTLKEKSEIIKNAGEQVFKGLLPIVDDFERGLKAAENGGDADSMLEGMKLIYNKLVKYLAQNGVKEMDPEDRDFDADRHEAISAVPVPDDSQKGKILDTVEKGYMINDKVLRHAKVVVGK